MGRMAEELFSAGLSMAAEFMWTLMHGISQCDKVCCNSSMQYLDNPI